jgi:Raf kinase inhibitor-like YbhB/YbcL family protein
MKLFTAVTVGIILSLGSAYAQDAGGGRGRGGRGGGGGGGGMAAPIKITIPAFSDGGAIPSTYGCAAGKNANLSPAIEWSGLPAGTATVALILHDPDLQIGADDVLHWAIFNIPGTASGLPQGVPVQATLDDGSVQIKNIGQSIGYFNPCPPPPTTHHYLFEFYALDQKLDATIASRADLMKAMVGHVRGKGIYIGTFHQ